MTDDQTSDCLPDQLRVSDSVVSATVNIWREIGEQRWVTASGSSMEPTIRHGDRMLVHFGTAGVQPGSVIVFSQRDMLLAHRVLRILSVTLEDETGRVVRRYGTKGDNALSFDGLIAEEDVLGRVLAVERNGQAMSLDTAHWRTAGKLIAVTAVASAAILAKTRQLKQRAFGASPNGSTKYPQKCARAATGMALRVASLFGRNER